MQKAFTILLSIIIIAAMTACGQPTRTAEQSDEKEAFIFTVPDWLEFGMKEGEVREHYDKEPLSSGQIILYASYNLEQPYKNYASYEISYGICYGFSANNKLALLSYTIDFNPSLNSALNPVDERTYLSEFEFMEKEISNEYGDPISAEETWFNEKYKDDEAMINYAIEKGDFIKISLWKTDDLYISLTLDKGIEINYTTEKDEWFYIE